LNGGNDAGNNQEEINLRTKGFARWIFICLGASNAKPFAGDEVSVSAERALPHHLLGQRFNSPSDQ